MWKKVIATAHSSHVGKTNVVYVYSVRDDHMCGNRETHWRQQKKVHLRKAEEFIFIFIQLIKCQTVPTNRRETSTEATAKATKLVLHTIDGESMGVRERFSHIARFNHKFASMVMTFVLDKMCSLCVSRRCRHHFHHQHQHQHTTTTVDGLVQTENGIYATANMSRLFNTSECRREVQRHLS